MYYAVIDIGSNTIRMVAYRKEQAELQILFSRKSFIKLIDEVDNGLLTSDGMDAIASSLKEFIDDLSALSGIKIYCFASAFFRTLKNEKVVINEIYSRCFLRVDILTPEQESNCALKGFLLEHTPVVTPTLLIGVGGSGTHLTLFQDKKITQYAALDIGSVRKTSHLVNEILPNVQEVEQIRQTIKQEIQRVSWLTKTTVDELQSIGGNGRALAKIHRYFHHQKLSSIHNYSFLISDLHEILQTMMQNPAAMILMLNEVVPGRINSIIPGIILVEEIALLTKAQRFTTSRFGTREGYLLQKIEIE